MDSSRRFFNKIANNILVFYEKITIKILYKSFLEV